MTDHFQIDVDPETLREVRRRMQELSTHLRDRGRDVDATPGDIGQRWTGSASVTVKGEMRGLGELMRGLAADAEAIAEGALSLARDYEDALARLPRMNSRYEQAQADYLAAVRAAGTARSEGRAEATPEGGTLSDEDGDRLDRQHARAVDSALETRNEAWHGLEIDFGYTRQWLGYQTRAFGELLVSKTRVGVPDSALEDLANGKLPPHPFDHSELLEGMELARGYEAAQIREVQEQAQDDVEELQALQEDPDLYDGARMRELLSDLEGRADDPVYAAAFAQAGGPDLLNDMYDLAQYYVNVGESEVEDWEKSFGAFNDVYAAGLGEYSDIDLAEFVRRFGNTETASRLGALAGSDYADERLPGLALTLSHYMDYNLPVDRDGALDLGRHMQGRVWDRPYEEMVAALSERTDPELLARVLNNADPDDREGLLRELGDLHAYGQHPLNADAYAVRTDMLRDLMTAARDGNFPETFESVLESLQHNEDSLELSQTDLDMKAFLTDEETLDFLARSRTQVDQETVAELYHDWLEDEDVQGLVEEMIRRNGEDGVDAMSTAENIGYLLGLADAADFDVDYSSAMGPITNAARDRLIEELGKAVPSLGKTVPGINVAIEILEGLGEQAAEAAERRAEHGEKWTDEQMHQNLAWIIYLQENGAPESYTDWLNDPEAQQSVSASDPLAAAAQYETWIADPDHQDLETLQRLRELRRLIDDARDP